MSSHNLRELEDVCDHVGIMNQGKVLLERSLSELQDTTVKLQVVYPGEEPRLPAELNICGQGQVLLTLREGKFHQAKRMLAFCGTPVVYLKRLSMGPLRLGEDLRPGEFRHLTQEEIDKLQQAVGLVAADCQKNDNNFCKIHKKPLANP